MALSTWTITLAGGALGEAKLVEGFEDVSKVLTMEGKLTPVKAGEGVTQGKQAAQLPAGASAVVAIKEEPPAWAAWLKLDTLGTEPVTYSLAVEFHVRGRRSRSVAHLEPGKDTLAVPLPAEAREVPKDKKRLAAVIVRIQNLSKSPLIVDYLRLESAARPPEGTLLLDFGRADQLVWPGFRAATSTSVNIVWTGDKRIHEYFIGYPDPLTGDFVGPALGYRQEESFEITPQGREPVVVWLWVTHYARGYSQPADYGVKFNGRVALRKQASPAALLGTAGCLEGKDGAWTPKWFDETYAERFAEVVSFSIAVGKGRVDLANCQVAAMAVAPAKHRVAMEAYVNAVGKEISAYRRHFVLGRREENLCALAPNEDELANKVMVFQLPHGASFQPDWTPDDSSRAKEIRLQAVNGGLATTCIAVAPIDESSHLSAALTDFRTERGRSLPIAPDEPTVRVIKTVPRVSDGSVKFLPWILDRRAGALKARQMTFLLISLRPLAGAVGDVYHATLRLSSSGGLVAVPVVLEVTGIGSHEKALEPVIGALTGADSLGIQRAHAEAKSRTQRSAATRHVRQLLMTEGIECLLLPGPSLDSELAVTPGDFLTEMKAYPTQQATGPTLLDIGGISSRLNKKGARAGTKKYRTCVKEFVAKTTLAAGRNLPGGFYFYLGDLSNRSQLTERSRLAREIGMLRGKSAGRISAQSLTRASFSQRRALRESFTALILTPDSKDLADYIADFKKAGRDRKAYILARYPDRYLTGFYARSLGADGCYLERVFMSNGGPYSGFWVRGEALVVPQPGGNFAATLATVRLRQGEYDHLLMARAEDLARRAKAAKLPAKELEKLLATIRSTAANISHLGYDNYLMRTTHVKPETLESWRTSLIKACAEAVKALEEKKQTPRAP
ncbi:MAG: hypothetical protein ACYTF6_08415 [Planctomycetota bacterium]